MKQSFHKSNLILIGMPGAGKTTIGKVLAELTGREFCDTDDLLRERYGMSLVRMIEAFGADGFKQRENRVCAELESQGRVIATGGSVVYGAEGMEHLRAIGCVIYLQVSEETEIRNLSDLPTRGVVMKPGETLSDLYSERVPLYEKYADYTVCCDGLQAQEVAARIISDLGI